jgi:hypothetical protein
MPAIKSSDESPRHANQEKKNPQLLIDLNWRPEISNSIEGQEFMVIEQNLTRILAEYSELMATSKSVTDGTNQSNQHDKGYHHETSCVLQSL